MDQTSPSLLARLRQSGAQDDWARLIALYKPFIERFIRTDAALREEAEDICQEVLRKVVTHFPRFERQRDGAFRAWLKVITVNEIRQYWRRRRRNGNRIQSDDPQLVDALLDPHNELSRRWDDEHTHHVLTRLQELVIQEFSAITWAAFRMRVFEQKSTSDVAAALGMSKNSVDIAKSRVLSRLREEAADLIEE